MRAPALPSVILTSRIVVVARRLERERLEALVALASDDTMVFEVTLDSESVLADIAWLRGLGHTVGAGTVMTIGDAERVADAGASFLVSPITHEGLIGWAADRGMPIALGAMTPTEIVRAWDAGASAVKTFPASVAGAALLREVRGPLGHVPLMPTGGMTSSNAADFLNAGAIAVGVGGWLTAAPEGELADRWQQLTSAVGAASA